MRPRPLFAQAQRPQPPKKKWRIFYTLKAALRKTCTTIGAVILFSIVIGMMFSSNGNPPAPPLPDKMVLYLPLEGNFAEHENQDGYSAAYDFGQRAPTLRETIDALDRATKDKRIKGLVADINGGTPSITQIQELRAAVARFRAAGKFAWIYAHSYGEGGGFGDYYLASAFDTIWMQPVGTVEIAGIRAEIPFGRALLDKLGIEPQFLQRKEYKSLFESANNSDISPASREETEALIDDIADQMTAQISTDRKFDKTAFQALVNKGLLTDQEALAAKLIDRLDYGDVLMATVRKTVTGDPQNEDFDLTDLSDYASQSHDPAALGQPKKKEVALVYIVGTIADQAGGGLMDGGSLSTSDDVVADIRAAADNDDINTIVIRIDSPGGSPSAAEAIRRAVVKAKEKKKYIIVSMGEAAASGGYWIAAPADMIVASPATLTGSIGVAGGKISLKGLWDKIGVNWYSVQWGQNAGMMSLNTPFSPTERERMDAMMDSIYAAFTRIVGEGRKLKPEQVEQVARGRVWSGRMAQKIGLVDELGGLDVALDRAAQKSGTKDRSDIHVVVYPKPMTPVERVLDFLETQAKLGTTLKTMAAVLDMPQNSAGVTAFEGLRVR